MILLKATTESLQIVTTTTAAIDYSISYADITTTTLSPSTSEGSITTATTTTVLAAPAGSTQRQVKLVSISNRGGATNTISVKKLISATTYTLTPTITLLAGESVQYMDGQGWLYYSASGSLKSSQNVAGSDTQVQFNNAGVLSGDPNLTWNATTNTLGIGGTTPQIQLAGVASTPAIPAAGTLDLYSQVLSGKTQLMKLGPNGDNEAIQSATWQNNIVLWTPGAAGNPGGSVQGTVMATTSSYSSTIALPSAGTVYGAMRKNVFTNSATLQQQVGLRTESMFFRGASTGIGGFFFACRFGLGATWTTGGRIFVGMSAATTGMLVSNEPTTVPANINTIGFGVNAGDTLFSFVHNDGSTSTKDAIGGQPVLAANTAYDAYIYCKPNDSTVYYRLENASTGAMIVDSSVTTTLPVNTVAMAAHCEMSNAAMGTGAGIVFGINKLYVETIR
jgi:hypothetical protein